MYQIQCRKKMSDAPFYRRTVEVIPREPSPLGNTERNVILNNFPAEMQKRTSFPVSSVKSKISQATIKEVVKLHVSNPKTRITEEAVQLLTECANILALEVTKRSIKQATSSDLKHVDVEHVEKILPQLMLDFT